MALELIRGCITELQISKGYEDLVFTDTSKSMVGAAAVGAVAMGQIFNSATLAMSSGGAELSMEYFTCVVDGKRLAGRFHKIGFKQGDKIEFVVEPTESAFAVLAARSPEQRLIWMLPYHERGHIAQKRSNIKWSLILSTAFAGAGTLFFFLYLPAKEGTPWWFFPSLFAVPFFVTILISLFIHLVFIRFSRSTTPILKAFGYEDAAQTDLIKLNRAALKRINQETGQPANPISSWVFRY